MKIYKSEETLLGRFGEDLKKLMIKYQIRSITPLCNDMTIEMQDDIFIMYGCNIQTNKNEPKIKNNVVKFPK
jgi:hypothetical protein